MNSNPVIPHYFGSKNVNGVYQFIINHIPPHRNYVEGFLGSGKILLTKKPASGFNIGIDKSAAVIDKFESTGYSYLQNRDLISAGVHSQTGLWDPARYQFYCAGFIDAFELLRARYPSMDP